MFKIKRNIRIGIYGPPNTGKTSLANLIISDFVGSHHWKVSSIPHETREIQSANEVILKSDTGKTLKIDLFDMPGLQSRLHLHTDAFDEFLDSGLTEEEAVLRLMEATEGIAQSVKWMKKIDSAIVVLDSTQSPFTKVNSLILGVLRANKVKVVVVANKIDLADANPERIRKALPNYPVVGLSALERKNTNALYEAITTHLR